MLQLDLQAEGRSHFDVDDDLSKRASRRLYLQTMMHEFFPQVGLSSRMRRVPLARDHPDRANVNSIERPGSNQFVFTNSVFLRQAVRQLSEESV